VRMPQLWQANDDMGETAMNWFERYGIPGAYFVLLCATLGLSAFWPDLVKNWTEARQGLAGGVAVGLAASIPIGYVLAIISQCLYYTPLHSIWHVHVPAWRWAWCNRTVRLPNETEPPCSEWRIEADTTFVARWKYEYLGSDGLQRSRFMQEWFAKRFDVMAMNSAMIFGTVLAVVLAVIGWNCGFFPYDRALPVLAWGVVSVTITAFFIVDNRILASQAIRIAREYMRDLDNEQDIRQRLRSP
jgi:hypothetical protein